MKPHGRSKHTWQDNIQTYFKELEWKGMDFILLNWNWVHWWSLVNTALNYRFPLKEIY